MKIFYRINCSNIEMNGVELDWKRIITRRKDGGVYIKNLIVEEDAMVESMMLRGHINNHHLEKMLNDTVFKNG